MKEIIIIIKKQYQQLTKDNKNLNYTLEKLKESVNDKEKIIKEKDEKISI